MLANGCQCSIQGLILVSVVVFLELCCVLDDVYGEKKWEWTMALDAPCTT